MISASATVHARLGADVGQDCTQDPSNIVMEIKGWPVNLRGASAGSTRYGYNAAGKNEPQRDRLDMHLCKS